MPRLKRTRPVGRTKLEARLQEHFGVTRARGLQKRSVRYYDIARRLGIPPPRLSEYVRGAYEIPWHHQMAICELLGCAPDDIVGDEESYVPTCH
jgi:DNA-binding Xre family transcriptional regulator